MWTRDGLVVAALVYGSRVLGEPRYLERAVAVMDVYLAGHYDRSGFFRDYCGREPGVYYSSIDAIVLLSGARI